MRSTLPISYLFILVTGFAIGISRAETLPNEALSPEESMTKMQFAEPFQLELVLADPVIQNPVAICWDSDGRLYVVEARQGTNAGRVSRHVDTDGDGWMDVHSVFVDKLSNPTSIIPLGNDFLVCDSPHLWKCESTSSKGKAKKTQITDQLPPEANTMLTGIDNWIEISGTHHRIKIESDQLVTSPTVTISQSGITKDSTGRLFYSDIEKGFNSLFVPAIYYASFPGTNSDSIVTDPVLRTGNFLKVKPLRSFSEAPEGAFFREPTDRKFSSAKGIEYFTGDQLDPDLKDNLFICEPDNSLVRRAQLDYLDNGHIGATNPYEGSIGEFLSSTDRNFSPVALATGPDGYLYILDQYTSGDDNKTGRIYRIVNKEVTRGEKPSLSKLDTKELVPHLAHPNGWWRDMAKNLIIAKGDDEVTEPIAEILKTHPSTTARLYALWTLSGLNALNENLISDLLKDPDSQIRVAAIRALEQIADEDDLSALLKVPSESPALQDLPVLIQLILSLGKSNQTEAASLIRKTIGQYIDDERYFAATLVSQSEIPIGEILSKLRSRPEYSKPSKNLINRIGLLARYAVKNRTPEEYSALLSYTEKQNPTDAKTILNSLAESIPNTETVALIQFESKPTGLTELEAREDLKDILPKFNYLFTWPGHPAFGRSTIKKRPPLSDNEQLLFSKGKHLYQQHCAECHGESGRASAGLAENANVESNASPLINLLLHGIESESELHSKPIAFHENDAELASVLTYIRRQWGNSGTPVIPGDIELVRAKSLERESPWKRDELDWTLPGTNKLKRAKAKPAPVEPPNPAPGLNAMYYPGNYKYIPDFSNLAPRITETTGSCRPVPPVELLSKTGFARRISGYLNIERPGLYSFYAQSKSGAVVLMNGGVLIDHDEQYSSLAETEISTYFKKRGWYPFEVQSIHTDLEDELVISYEGPGFLKQEIPREMFCHEADETPVGPTRDSKLADSRMKLVPVINTDRHFYIHSPKSIDKDSAHKLPTIIILGNTSTSPVELADMTALNSRADIEGFSVVYPNIEKRQPFGTFEYEIEEVDFMKALLEQLEANYHSDPNRFYLAGFSDGCIPASFLASRLSHRIAAYGSVAGTGAIDNIKSLRALPVLHIHGTRDSYIPEQGGTGKNGTFEYQSINQMMRLWVIHNRSGIIPGVEHLPDTVSDECNVIKYQYPRDGYGSAETVYIQIKNGGHTWPGAKNSPEHLGKVCRDINGGLLLWDFFKRYHLPF